MHLDRGNHFRTVADFEVSFGEDGVSNAAVKIPQIVHAIDAKGITHEERSLGSSPTTNRGE